MGASPECCAKWAAHESGPPLFSSEFIEASRRSSVRPIAWHSMSNLASRQRRDGDLLPHIDAAFVQLRAENPTMEFVPSFLIMHSSVESRAAH
jgi:hypothetical protein